MPDETLNFQEPTDITQHFHIVIPPLIAPDYYKMSFIPGIQPE